MGFEFTIRWVIGALIVGVLIGVFMSNVTTCSFGSTGG